MKIFVVFAFLVVVINATSVQELWVQFKKDYGKTFKSLGEDELRFNIFKKKLREIDSHNKKYDNGEVSYFLAVNQFSDMTAEEFAKLLDKKLATKPDFHAIPAKEVNSNFVAPSEINWVEKGAVLEVEDQGECRSCWAFSTTGALEGLNFIHYNKSISLSEQQLVDCVTENWGCKGGYMTTAFDYVVNNGLASESDYPYEGNDGTCKHVAMSAVNISGYVVVDQNESALLNAVGSVGPVSIALDAELWGSYGGGIFFNEKCRVDSTNHAVLAVGYGEENGNAYWLIKNSWGKSWGEKGYIRLARNKNNQCGVSTLASYPTI